jgi:uncharacterized protein YcnI
LRVLLAALLTLLFAAPAAAHVSVIPQVARPGDTLELTFRVPNERADAATTALELFLPKGVPATIADHPGWAYKDKGGGDIAWTPSSAAAAIAPGRTQDFKVTLGPLPKTDRIVFKALQTYADGQIVRWIQTSGPDDERPAAILDLSGNGGTSQSSTSPAVLVGAAVAILAIVAVLVVLRRRRRS